MRYTIIINKNDETYTASVPELPCVGEVTKKDINEAITEIKEKIKNSDENLTRSKIVFNYVSSSAFYYTLNDKRDDISYLITRIASLLAVVILIYAISNWILYPNLSWCFCLDIFKLDIKIEEDGNKLFYVLKAFAVISSILTTIWAIQSYWRLRYIDQQAEKWRPHDNIDEWSDPFTFHVLAESHKQWAELWFSWCVAIFTSGITYAIFKVIDHTKQYKSTITGYAKLLPEPLPWPNVFHDIFSGMAPNAFIYLLFGAAWYWSSKHYRSHWHNFVINAYRHRALYRLDQLRNDIRRKVEGEFLPNHKADETILELYRLSGALLVIPGDSSYLDKVGSEEITKTHLQMEEITKAFSKP